MESWGTAVFLLTLALAMIALGVVVTRMVKSVDPNDAAELVSDGTRYDIARIYTNAQDDRNEKTWGWRLAALERRVHAVEEKSRELEARSYDVVMRSYDVEMRSLRLSVSHSADKARTALQTANEALVVANTVENDMRRVIDGATLRAAIEVFRNAELNDSTPEDDNEEERVAAMGVNGYCVHGNPVEFHYEGGCDT